LFGENKNNPYKRKVQKMKENMLSTVICPTVVYVQREMKAHKNDRKYGESSKGAQP
jgi:hypothetical protein